MTQLIYLPFRTETIRVIPVLATASSALPGYICAMTSAALWLGIYASAVASATGLWTLFRELWLERARLDVEVGEAWLVKTRGGGRLVVKGQDTLRTMGVTESQRTPILEVVVRNRGRRDAQVRTVAQVRDGGGHYLFGDLVPQLPYDVPAERTGTLVVGETGGYSHGDVSPRRFFVVDGAGRVHPLGERWRQKLAPRRKVL